MDARVAANPVGGEWAWPVATAAAQAVTKATAARCAGRRAEGLMPIRRHAAVMVPGMEEWVGMPRKGEGMEARERGERRYASEGVQGQGSRGGRSRRDTPDMFGGSLVRCWLLHI